MYPPKPGLRAKTSFLIISILALTSVVIYSGVALMGARQVLEIEDREAEHDVAVVRDALAATLTELGATAEAWGGWDDTRRMVIDPEFRKTYIAEAGRAEILGPTGIELMAFVDLDDKLLHVVAVDLSRGAVATAPPAAFIDTLKATSGILESTVTTEQQTGIVVFDEGPMLVAVQPITNNDFSAAPVGRVIIGRYLNSREERALATKTRLDVDLLATDDAEIPAELRAPNNLQEVAYSGVHVDQSSKRCLTYAAVDDYSGTPALVMRIARGRAAYGLFQNTSLYLLLALTALTAIAGFAVYFVLNRLVHVKVDRLVGAVRTIGNAESTHVDIDMPGSDELAVLGNAIDDMVHRMQATNVELARATDRLRNREAALQEMIESLAEASMAKDRFLANMSHELRTPLNSIIGFSQMLERRMPGELNEEQAKQVSMIHTSGEHLLSLIDDILDLAKIQADKMNLTRDQTSLSEVLAELEQTSASLMDGDAVTFEVVPPQPDVLLFTDRRRLLQVLLNLTGNAAKFTAEGRIVVSTARTDHSVAISVADTGVGIAAECLSIIMDEFTQVGSEMAGRPPGTGLGLAISSRLARMLGGSLTVESTPGVGSTFTLTIPLDSGVAPETS